MKEDRPPHFFNHPFEIVTPSLTCHHHRRHRHRRCRRGRRRRRCRRRRRRRCRRFFSVQTLKLRLKFCLRAKQNFCTLLTARPASGEDSVFRFGTDSLNTGKLVNTRYKYKVQVYRLSY